jgi:hypothetical protein
VQSPTAAELCPRRLGERHPEDRDVAINDGELGAFVAVLISFLDEERVGLVHHGVDGASLDAGPGGVAVGHVPLRSGASWNVKKQRLETGFESEAVC